MLPVGLLFEFNRCGRFAGAVVEHAVDAFDFVDDAARGLLQDFPRQLGALGGHEVARHDGAQGDGVVVGAAVAHDADAAHVRQRGEVLAEALDAGLGDFLAVDGVCFLDDLDLLGRDLADDADAEAWARERLTAHEVLRQAEFAAGGAHFILEEQAQRLDDLLEVDEVRQAADVVVALDDGRLAEAALDDVWVDRALDEVVDGTDLLGLFLEDADEFLADDLALLLRLRHALELLVEAVLGVDADEVEVVRSFRSEDGLNLVALVLAQQAVVDEDAGQLLADGLGEQHGCDGRVDAARQRAECLARANLGLELCDRRLDEGVHLPVALALADAVDEVVEHLLALLRVHDFRMELRRVETALGVLHRGDRADRREGRDREAFRCLGDVVRMAHPADALLAHTFKELRALARFIERDFRLAVLARRRRLDLAAEQMCHELRTVADAEHRDAEIEDLGAAGHGIFRVDAVRAARQDDALRRHLADLLQRKRLRMDFAVDMVLAHAARDELIVLATEVQYENHFIYRLAQFFSSQIKTYFLQIIA